MYLFFFFNDTATTEIYTYGHTLSLHDALPIADPRFASDLSDLRRRNPGRSLSQLAQTPGIWRSRRGSSRRPRARPWHRRADRKSRHGDPQIGRASCRERVCQYRVDLGGRRIIKKKRKHTNIQDYIKQCIHVSTRTRIQNQTTNKTNK